MILDNESIYNDSIIEAKNQSIKLLKKMDNDTALVEDFYPFKRTIEKLFKVLFIGNKNLTKLPAVSSAIVQERDKIAFFSKDYSKAELNILFEKICETIY